MKHLIIALTCTVLLSSCVAKKKFAELKGFRDDLQVKAENCDKELIKAQASLAEQSSKVKDLEDQLDYLKKTNTNLLDRLADLSVISQSTSESMKKSLDAINEQGKYIKDLNRNIQVKDSLNLALVTNLKRSLSDVNDQDVQVEVKKGVIYISLSDKMLFKSGSAKINTAAENVLGKIAKVVNDHKELDILVEGHTDNVSISTDCLQDNWDLSVLRSTAIVRTLQTKYDIAPSRMTAGGRSEFVPKASNETAEGRSMNRRTEIIILPKLDQFFQLVTPTSTDSTETK